MKSLNGVPVAYSIGILFGFTFRFHLGERSLLRVVRKKGPLPSVVLPAYNEAARIRSDRLQRLDNSLSVLGYESEVLVIDDGSEDATADHLGAGGAH